MTGRDLILYILTNKLEDQPVFEDGMLIGFDTEGSFAEKCEVGIATVRAWVQLGIISAICIGDTLYIPSTELDSIKRREELIWID